MDNFKEKIAQCDADIEARKVFVGQYDKDYIGVFQTAEEALEAAEKAQKILMKDFSVEDRQRFIDAAKAKFTEHLEEMSLLERIETGYGRYEDKLKKNGGSYAFTVGTEAIPVQTYTGSKGLTMEYFAPFGVIGAITPVTNPSSTIYANSRHNIAVGNAIIFNPHPAARVCSKWSVGLFNEAVVEAGGPANLCVTTDYPTMDTLDVIMKCPFVKLLVGTGGPAMVKTLMTSGKKIIAAGDGNPPCIVDASADVEKAVVGIIGSSVMENNIMCTAEKEIFVVADVYDEFIAALEKQQTRHLTTEESEILIKNCLIENPDGSHSANKKFVGKDAAVILNACGIEEKGDPSWPSLRPTS
jgi:propionaldehyde dehydrogenase